MKDQNSTSGSVAMGIVIFLVGFIGALVFGWVIFPNLLYSEKPQPINFSHSAHQDSGCEACHFFRSDGSYTGIPKVDNCRECHESAQGGSESERILIEEYIQKDREIPWQVYAWQPDNVYFSHAPHKGQGMECTRCHLDVAKADKLPPAKTNRITGYSISTMKMVECEECHAQKGASNNCEICHK
jgi:menaquinone reductase, multiheme cytochrome c subunit